ncbi:major facilitator superfamily domain-containing protein 7-a-like [Acanthaster planci]|uniref:Major facilitator superfamily domain-containing protein 7-a-like n=1 Tax=Acanthaster planci TaxID=133434 RepID=A0A8B7XJ46_ACAPL|nr:major facilitator superfamily domain-containing protein 7-a-like [Acanthaster planci]
MADDRIAMDVSPSNEECIVPRDSPTHGVSEELVDGGTKSYRLYKTRWWVLATLSALNFSNAMAWICFAAITNITATYYQVSPDDVNWLSLIYLVVTVPIGFIASWVLDTFGIRTGMLIGSWTNLLGIILRYLSTLSTLPADGRFAVVMCGQGLAAFAQPFLLFAPTKLAAVWFPENQRAIANTLGSMANPLGILISFLVSSAIVSVPSDLPTMLWVYIIPAAVACAMCTLGVRQSSPPTPPTASAAGDHETFYAGMKKCVRNVPFMILFLTFGGGYGLFNALSTFMEQIVCPLGYNDDFAGLVGGLMIAFGLIGAVISGLIVDRTRAFTPVTKTCFSLAVLCAIVMSVFTHFDNMGIPIAVFGVGFGLFGFALFPVALELGVECTHPVAEGTSAGLLQISGQFQGIILILIGQYLAQPLNTEDKPIQQCIPVNVTTMRGTYVPITSADNVTWVMSTTGKPNVEPRYIQDMSIPLYIFCGYALVSCLILAFVFKTKYKRIEAERYTKESNGGIS